VIDGLWIVQFHGPQSVGGGVVVLTRGQVLGGDSGFTYSGTYELKDNMLKAKVLVKNFDSAIPNVLGIPGDFNLLVEGRVQGDNIEGTGALTTHPDVKMVVRLTKFHSLT
jgi:T3SS negative regulator,GrlR